jgi:hypothetical protein
MAHLSWRSVLKGTKMLSVRPELKQKPPQITAAKAAVNVKPAQTGYCTYAIAKRAR